MSLRRQISGLQEERGGLLRVWSLKMCKNRFPCVIGAASESVAAIGTDASRPFIILLQQRRRQLLACDPVMCKQVMQFFSKLVRLGQPRVRLLQEVLQVRLHATGVPDSC